MKLRWKAACAALSLFTTLTIPAFGASVEAEGKLLPEEQGWIENGVSYMTLRSLEELTGYELSWNGRQARMQGEELELTAQPGALYIEVNDRALYVEDGVGVRDGAIYLPLRVVAQATGGILTWDEQEQVARLCLLDARPALANYNLEDLEWLARVISAESRGEPLEGQIAVGNVVLNRVNHKNYPNTVKEVVFDRTYAVQFEPTENGTIYDEPTPSAMIAAKLCLEGANVVEDCIYFFAPALSSGSWIVKNADYFKTIGCHRFYRE